MRLDMGFKMGENIRMPNISAPRMRRRVLGSHKAKPDSGTPETAAKLKTDSGEEAEANFGPIYGSLSSLWFARSTRKNRRR